MDSEMKLLPCPLPWCGKARDSGAWDRRPLAVFDPEAPQPVTMSGHSFGHDEHWVRCGTCGLDSPQYATEAEAIAAWNARTPDPAIVKLREALEAIIAVDEPEGTGGGSSGGFRMAKIARAALWRQRRGRND